MRPLFVVAAVGALMAGCAVVAPPPSATIAPFSANADGADWPRGWEKLVISRTKAPTGYRLVADSQNGVVVKASARRSASGLMQALDIDPRQQPVIAWRWRLTALIDGADNTDRHAEDSPVRLLLFFDGDRARLPRRDQVSLELAETLTGRRVPYATLMYIWENRQPVGAVIQSAHTGRVRMMVAGSGGDGLGRWHRLERDYVADFERAFGEAPGRLVGVGIMTDTDNTGAEVEAYYGDIELRPAS
jgi:hypothetical protein